jgi:hypothetical protein
MNRRVIASEILKIAKELSAVEFDTEDEKKKYQQEHEVRPGTKLTVKEKEKPSAWREKAKKSMPLHDLLDRAWELNAEREVLRALNSGNVSHIPKHLMDDLGPLFKKAIR